jgi:hypothetical protein
MQHLHNCFAWHRPCGSACPPCNCSSLLYRHLQPCSLQQVPGMQARDICSNWRCINVHACTCGWVPGLWTGHLLLICHLTISACCACMCTTTALLSSSCPRAPVPELTQTICAVEVKAACPVCILAGHYVPQVAAKTSTACQPGYFTPSAGSISCTPCAYSTFSDAPGSASCTTCPHSTHTPGVPAKSIKGVISTNYNHPNHQHTL